MALEVDPLDLWATPQDARAAVQAVADGRVQVEGDDDEGSEGSEEAPDAAQEAPDAAQEAPDAAQEAEAPDDEAGRNSEEPEDDQATAAAGAAPRQPAPGQLPAADGASRAAAARAYGLGEGVAPAPEPPSARRGIELPSPPADLTEAARQAAREQLFEQLPDEAGEPEQIEAGIDAIAQFIYEANHGRSVPAPALRWLVFAWLARIIAPETIQPGATDPVDRSDVTNPPRKLLVAYSQADQLIEQRIEAETA